MLHCCNLLAPPCCREHCQQQPAELSQTAVPDDVRLLHPAAGGIITDLLSFYTLPSTVIGNEKYDTLTAAYMYYTVATETPLSKLMQDALILAKKS